MSEESKEKSREEGRDKETWGEPNLRVKATWRVEKVTESFKSGRALLTSHSLHIRTPSVQDLDQIRAEVARLVQDALHFAEAGLGVKQGLCWVGSEA